MEHRCGLAESVSINGLFLLFQCKFKIHRLKPVLLSAKTRNRAPIMPGRGLRIGHRPGGARARKILRRGGGPCPGFRRAARKGFGRWNSISI